MTISSDEAGAMLREVVGILAKVKRSRLYRTSGEAFMVWGAVVVAGDVLSTVAPRGAGWGWAALNLLGVVATIVLLQRRMRGGAAAAAGIPLRFLAVFAVFFAFWLGLAPRHRGVRPAAGGRVLADPLHVRLHARLALVRRGVLGDRPRSDRADPGGFFFSGEWFPLWPALVEGGGLMLCGYWMRRS